MVWGGWGSSGQAAGLLGWALNCWLGLMHIILLVAALGHDLAANCPKGSGILPPETSAQNKHVISFTHFPLAKAGHVVTPTLHGQENIPAHPNGRNHKVRKQRECDSDTGKA